MAFRREHLVGDIIADGVDGYLVDRDDAPGLARCLLQLTRDEPANRAMGKKARATVEARYSENVTANAFIEVFDKLLDVTSNAN